MIKFKQAFVLATMGLAFAMPVQPAAAAPLADFLGRWSPVNNTGRGLLHLRIRNRDGVLRVIGRGGCRGQRCRWGRANARAYGIGPTGKINSDTRMIVADLLSPQGVRRLLMIRLLKGNRLQIQALIRGAKGTTPYYNVFTMKRRLRDIRDSGRGSQTDDRGLPPTRQDGSASTEACTVFEPQLVLALPIGGEWKLIHLGYTIKNFGDKRWEAERAARVIRQYQLRRRCHADRRGYIFEYWRHKNGIPKGASRGEDCFRIYPGDAKIKRASRTWQIHAWDQRYASAGSQSEARYILRTMQQYNPSHLCQIGTGGRAMLYLRK